MQLELSGDPAHVTTLVGKYHDETAEKGRSYRVVVAVHPSVPEES